MKKFTLSTLALSLTLAGFAQTTIRDFEDGANGEFGFKDEMNNPKSEVEIVANPEKDDVNGSDSVIQYTGTIAQTDEDFIGFGFNESLDIGTSDQFIQLMVRSDENNVPVRIQLSDDASPATFNPSEGNAIYTGNGKWQKLEVQLQPASMDFSVDPPVDRGVNTTGMFGKVIVFINQGTANPAGQVFFIDNITWSMNALSTNEFETNNVAVYLDRSASMLHIDGQLESKELTVYDLAGRSITTETVSGTQTEINVAGLSSGIYFVATENGAKKFAL